MLEKAKEKGVYKKCITAMLGRASIKGINRGVQGRIQDFSQECVPTLEQHITHTWFKFSGKCYKIKENLFRREPISWIRHWPVSSFLETSVQ